MRQTDEHVAQLLARPIEERAKAGRMLLDSLDEDGADADTDKALVASLHHEVIESCP